MHMRFAAQGFSPPDPYRSAYGVRKPSDELPALDM